MPTFSGLHSPDCNPSRHGKAGRACYAGLIAAFALLVGIVTAAPDLDRMQRLAHERYGAKAEDTVSAWRRMMNEARQADVNEQLERVNDFFNRRIRFEDDMVVWGQPDYWATPLETMGKGAGDCEDFAIAKYMTLRLLGIPGDKLRLIYVRAQIGGPSSAVTQAHMVLGYFGTPTAEALVLDNLIGEIRPATRRTDLFPVFSFNMEGLWAGGAHSSSADPTTRLSRWRDVIDRMRREGLQ